MTPLPAELPACQGYWTIRLFRKSKRGRFIAIITGEYDTILCQAAVYSMAELHPIMRNLSKAHFAKYPPKPKSKPKRGRRT